MIIGVETIRLLNWRAAAKAGHGAPDPFEASVAKCYANETAKKVSDLAIQLHGGYGYHPEYHVERMHRDAHGWALAGGTPTIQRTRIVSELPGPPLRPARAEADRLHHAAGGWLSSSTARVELRDAPFQVRRRWLAAVLPCRTGTTPPATAQAQAAAASAGGSLPRRSPAASRCRRR